nr:PREDICTED: LOW QUALITY PROTEIN: glutamine synthetase nodule isozyme [Musa acuminata subsp. malaccensis]
MDLMNQSDVPAKATATYHQKTLVKNKFAAKLQPSASFALAGKILTYKQMLSGKSPMYGIEQEYTLLQKDVKWPLGWPVGGFPGPQGPYYCAAGEDKAFGRDIVDAHYKARLFAGINIGRIIGELLRIFGMQWEFQLGPAVGISAGDELWVARYILERITEIAGVVLSFDPKPIQGDWNGAGAHTCYTKSMRCDGGYEIIKEANKKLLARGTRSNERRLTGRHETADINTFLWVISKTGGQHQTRIPMSSLP